MSTSGLVLSTGKHGGSTRARVLAQECLRWTVLSSSVRHVSKNIPPRQRLADVLLGRPVLDYIAEYRADGKSWPQIRDLLRDATDGEIDVSWQALQQWVGRAERVVADGDAA